MAQHRLGLGERQQVVKIDGLACRPGDMFRDERGLVALNEGAEAREMRLVQGLRSADRHAHAVQRNGMVAANSLEGAMRRAAGAHVVLGVNLEEAARLRPREDRLQVLGLEACPRQSRNRMRGKQGAEASRSEYAGRTLIMACPRFPALTRMWRVDLHSRQRSVLAVRQHDRRAGPADDELPGIALEIDGGGPLTGRAGSGGAVVLSLERDAVTLLLVRSGSRLFFGLRQRRSGGERRQCARYGAR